MNAVSYRELTEADLPKLADIDRSETIRVGFKLHHGNLVQRTVQWDAPDFFKEGDGEHTLARQIAFCQRHLAANATMIGAFDEDKLVGIGVLTPEIRPKVAQLAYLQISSPYRRRGIGSSITLRLVNLARDLGANLVYVSATPSQSAVGFYSSFGFTPVAEPLPELHALEPEDIHMALPLLGNDKAASP